MFSYVFDVIFEICYEFVSYLTALATCTVSDFAVWVNGLEPIIVTNVITGATTEWFCYVTPLIGGPITLFISVMTFGISSSYPLWLALVIAVINGFLVISIVKFIIHVIL